MLWAILWAFLIGSAAEADKTGASAGILAFLAIWYFASKADTLNKVGQRMIDERQRRIDDLELSQSNNTAPKQEVDL